MTDASSAQRVFVDIADQLRSDIAQGVYADGERLPGEDELAANFGVASRTINRAVDLLKNDGHAIGRRGSGVYAQTPLAIRYEPCPDPAEPQGRAGAWAAGEPRAFDIDLSGVTSEQPPAGVASVLGLGTKQAALTWRARFSVQGRPVMLTRTFVPAELVPAACAAKDDASPRRLTVLLSDLGLSPAEGVVETRGRAPSGEDCDLLEIPVGRFVLDSRVTVWDAQMRPLAVEQTVMDTAAFVVAHSIKLGEAG
ncbi:GntR family transcriptional regulator [Streptomyces sp. NPDC005538]|uniref:GntR family transcriptional regulator n=1 Tax=Streptomyces sp. NPDC005538 TaxID=3157043 RepID=UPI0033ABC19D